MTTSTARHRWVDVIDLEDTVTIHHPIGEATQRLFPIPRDTEARPDAAPRTSFAVLSPSGEQPLAAIDPNQTAILDALQLRFARYASSNVDVRPGRHRAERPSLFARLFGRGRRDGV